MRGPLHGIPIALKDNMQTIDMPTTGGALAFDGLIPPYEATLTKNLHDAGAIIIAKTTMTELANWVAGGPTPMPGGYNAAHRIQHESVRSAPRSARRYFRRPSGAGNRRIELRRRHCRKFLGRKCGKRNVRLDSEPIESEHARRASSRPWAESAGTELFRSPRTRIRPGRWPGPSPMRPSCWALSKAPRPIRTIRPRRSALLLPGATTRRFLKPDGLKGARIGIPAPFTTTCHAARRDGACGRLNPDQKKVMDEAIAVAQKAGRGNRRSGGHTQRRCHRSQNNILKWNTCSGLENAKGKDADCSVDFKYGMKRDFNKWLASLGAAAPVKSLTELRKFNLAHAKAGAIKYGQSQLDISDEMDLEADRARYEADRAKDLRLAGEEGIDAVLKKNNLDALIFPGASGAAIAAKAGYPTVIVPFGTVPNAPAVPFPPGFAAKPVPLGVAFTGTACSEPRLIGLAYSFEQATKRRVPPPLFP